MALGLDRVREALGSLGDPQRHAPAIHVAGTNGKGVTCAYASAILRHAGKRVGLYTSPHLSRPNERIAIDGRPIGDDAFASALTAVRDANVELTFFEALTCASFVAFRDAGVDAAVLETGLGGRLDATNVAQPVVTAITSIDLDHTAILGETIEKIAAEKAGIVKPRTPVVIAERKPIAVEVIEARAKEVESTPFLIDRDYRWHGEGRKDPRFTIDSDEPAEIVVRDVVLPGDDLRDHLRDAAATAALAARILEPDLEEDAIREGLADAAWPGRGERLAHRGASVILDGAHNPGAASKLVGVRSSMRQSPVVVFAAMRDKDVEGVLRVLAGLYPAALVCTTVGLPRSMAAGEIAGIARRVWGKHLMVREASDPESALDMAAVLANHGPVVVTGSLYLVGRVRERLAGPPERLG